MPDFDLDADIDATIGPSEPKKTAKPTRAPAPSAPAPLAPAPAAEFNLDADIDSIIGADEPAPVEQKKPSKVIEMPVQTVEYDPSVAGTEAPKPAEQKPWYSSLLPNAKAVLHGMAAGATMNFGDEGAAALSSGLSSVLPGMHDPDGYTREYKAGSQYEDMRSGLANEDAKLREENPGSFIGGQMLGATPAAIASAPAFAAVRPALGAGLGLGARGLAAAEAATAGAAQGAVAGAGAAQPGERLKGAAVGGAEGAIAGGALHGVSQGLTDVANNSTGAANRLLVQTFMTPAQRHRYETAKGGPKALDQLGADAREAGLFGGPLRQLLPTRARNVANNAAKVMQKSGNTITDFEDDLAREGINPDVDIQPVVKNLRGAAAEENVPAADSAGAVRLLNKQADMLEQPSSAPVSGKVEAPPEIPEWARNKPSGPQYGAAIEPVQEPLPGTELPPVAADRPLPPPTQPEQLSMPTPRAMPERQLPLDLTPEAPARPEPVQMQMDLPRQQPTRQTELGLEPQQAKLPLPPAEAVKRTRPEMTFDQLPAEPLPSGGAAQENMFLGSEPARPPAPPAAPPEPVQGSLELPAPQMELPLAPPRPNPFRPEARPAEQLNLPVQQELPVASKAPVAQAVQQPAPVQPPTNPLAGRQEVLPLENPNRGPQPELSTPLPDSAAQITRDSLPFSDATKLKRFLGKRIDWQKNPNAKASKYEQDAARKITWKGISDQIDAALKGDSRVDQGRFANYSQAKKNFHTAATAFDPALKMAEREGEVGLGARDMLAAAAFGGNPLTGGLAAMANKQISGVLPSTAASAVRATGKVAGGLAPLLKGAGKVSPVTFARQQNPGASDAEVKQKANEQVKRDLQPLLERGRK